jgi:hypothetical protein
MQVGCGHVDPIAWFPRPPRAWAERNRAQKAPGESQ